MNDRLWIWIESYGSVWIGSGVRIRMKGGRLSVLMKNNRLNDGTNRRTDDRPNNDWTDDWTNDGTNHNRGLMVSSEFVFENALTVAIGEFKSASTAIFCF